MEARQELAKLQSGGIAPKDKDVTLEGAYELWKTKAISNDYSPNSLKNTQQQYNILCQFISKDFRIKDIDESVYLDLSRKCREYGYSEGRVVRTIRSSLGGIVLVIVLLQRRVRRVA